MAEEERLLAETQRQCDRIHAQFRELVLRLPLDRRPEMPAEPPRFASIEEGRAYMDRIRALLRG
ncbi:hypothetical protein [Nocardiopsis sp. FIRDI 009]|uniref:hypothetical protein n=1 Tax=Nocardiopsis sp. FIRDI 009 TaxID=714197 RepID=UPI001300AB97|nr:hypothetical protein [Nocardiopsis sp. FIRDI 009]